MKSQVSRIIAWCLALGVVALWFLQGGSLAERKSEFEDLVSQLSETLKNTEDLEALSKEKRNALLKECSALEEEDGVVTGEIKEWKGRVEVLNQQIADEDAKIAVMQQEMSALPDRLTELRTTLASARQKTAPFEQDETDMKAERADLDSKLVEIRMSIGGLQAKLSVLKDKREVIRRNYEERSAVLREKIEEPPWVYYGDKTQTKVMNVRPSMTGVFLPLGIGDGLKRGTEFLVRRLAPPVPTRKSWPFKLKIVQSDYSFAIIMPEFGDQDIPLRAGEEVEMERSGNLASEESENEENTSAINP